MRGSSLSLLQEAGSTCKPQMSRSSQENLVVMGAEGRVEKHACCSKRRSTRRRSAPQAIAMLGALGRHSLNHEDCVGFIEPRGRTEEKLWLAPGDTIAAPQNRPRTGTRGYPIFL